MTSYVPLLSLASLSDPTDVAGRMALAKQVGEAARGSGFMQVVRCCFGIH